jgi:hypothetical protein
MNLGEGIKGGFKKRMREKRPHLGACVVLSPHPSAVPSGSGGLCEGSGSGVIWGWRWKPRCGNRGAGGRGRHGCRGDSIFITARCAGRRRGHARHAMDVAGMQSRRGIYAGGRGPRRFHLHRGEISGRARAAWMSQARMGICRGEVEMDAAGCNRGEE